MSDTELNKVSFDEFPIPDYDQWVAEVDKALKGAPFGKKMFTPTYEGITLEPIYTPRRNQEAIATSVFPGSGDFGRGTKASGYIAVAWGIAQYVEDSLPEKGNETALEEIKKGCTVYNIHLDEATRWMTDVVEDAEVGKGGVSISTLYDVETLMKGFDHIQHPLYIEAGSNAAPILSVIVAHLNRQGVNLADVRGTVGADPIGEWVKAGSLPLSLDTSLDAMAHTVAWTRQHMPHMRTILVSGDPYHNGGANDVQEIAYAFSTAIYYIRELKRRGLSVDDIADSIQFAFSLGANFFMEISKLRSIRLLWSQILEALGASESHRKAYIHGRTSLFTKTMYDPYVNMLRDTTQAFSGVVGGLDSLEVSPFDVPIRKSDVFSRRIARNIQVMMSTEFELRQPVDPAGGSWYIETLSLELCDAIWKEFQVVEGKGGIVPCLTSGYVQEQVRQILQARFTSLESRKDVAVGNNMYANMTETRLESNPEDQGALQLTRMASIKHSESMRDGDKACALVGQLMEGSNEAGQLMELLIACANEQVTLRDMRKALEHTDVEMQTIERIDTHRWTENFEKLRIRTENYKAETGDNVRVMLANMGPIPQHKPRADFSRGFMEVGAFEVIGNDGFETPEEAAAEAITTNPDVVVICSTDATYPEIVPILAKIIKAANANITVLLAGAPPKDLVETYKEAGVDDFIHVKANCYQLLRSLQDKKGMPDYE